MPLTVSSPRIPTGHGLRPVMDTWAWQAAGSCRGKDIDLFFVPDGVGRRERRRREDAAKRICGSCPVRTACLRHAVRVGESFGIWGGTTPDERRGGTVREQATKSARGA
jgi:WhiB family redox-sensing transcriptional regulator